MPARTLGRAQPWSFSLRLGVAEGRHRVVQAYARERGVNVTPDLEVFQRDALGFAVSGELG